MDQFRLVRHQEQGIQKLATKQSKVLLAESTLDSEHFSQQLAHLLSFSRRADLAHSLVSSFRQSWFQSYQSMSSFGAAQVFSVSWFTHYMISPLLFGARMWGQEMSVNQSSISPAKNGFLGEANMHQSVGNYGIDDDKTGVDSHTQTETIVALIAGFVRLMEVRDAGLAEHCRRVAELARSVAIEMHLSAQDVTQIFAAGLMHDMGKQGLDKNHLLMADSYSKYAHKSHTSLGADIIERASLLRRAALFIKHHHERVDGKGFPMGLKGDEIPLGARVLAVAEDYDELTLEATQAEVFALLRAGKGSRYDAEVVDCLINVVKGLVSGVQGEAALSANQLDIGMELSRDIVVGGCLVLQKKGAKLSRGTINQLCALEAVSNASYTVWVRV